MAQERKKYVTLYNPDHGTQVEVDENRAEVLKSRGYTTSKPRQIAKASRGKAAGPDPRVAELEAELAQAKADLEAATAPPK